MLEGRDTTGRIILIAGLALLLVGVVVAVVDPDGVSSPVAGVSIRAGAVLAALGLSIPLWRRPSAMATLGVGLLVGLVLLRPSLIWVALLAALGWALFGRQRKRADRDS